MPTDYWIECIETAAEECGAALTKEQIKFIATDVEGAHENFGMAHGHDAIPNPRELELNQVSQQLKEEQDKVLCEECKGRGRIVIQGPYHSSDSECSKCRGEWRYLPYRSKVEV